MERQFGRHDASRLFDTNIRDVERKLIHSKITKLSKEVFPTDLHWFPANAGGKRLASDLFVLASTDGKYF